MNKWSSLTSSSEKNTERAHGLIIFLKYNVVGVTNVATVLGELCKG